jgi:hypothetical protein
MKHFEFTVTYSGEGETAEEAWNDAMEQADNNYGCWDRYTEEEMEDEEYEDSDPPDYVALPHPMEDLNGDDIRRIR